jgi:hypothetical protein
MPVEIRTRTAPPARGAPGEIDTLFVISADTALTASTVSRVRSLSDYEVLGATRSGDPITYDGLDTFFREGGRTAYVTKKGVDFATTLPAFTEDLGGGQVVAWNAAPVVADYTALLDHAKTNKRFALLDVALTDDTVAKLVTAAGKNPTPNADYGAMFGPWVNTPPPNGVIGATTRTVPATAVVAGLIARADSLGNPNRAPAGRDFPLQYATSLVGPTMTDLNTATLRDAGLNPLRSKFGLMVLDGFQTKILSDPDDPFWQANVSRARMWLQWQSVNVGLNYEYKTIDGRGRLTAGLQGDLSMVCRSLWEVNGLFGETSSDAYSVNVGVSINTTQTVAYGELHAVVEARFSLHARLVVIELVAVPITGRVSA